MNARQRRKAYRAMPAVGTQVEWMTVNGTPKRGTAVGPKPIHVGQFNEERLNVPSVHRVRVRFESGSHAHPLTSGLRVVA
ncbi:hypothetical protein KTE46_09975 [Burkholderia multivorans]|uniref:hypothetical protein n=1 Tax=Burkholderia multivorans TaxID=87883 RepID=UPI001C214937|nr:hypothetical protein [Burkholderia multivorans]MBU9405998.1 hypothetical protein [Burkholderia multivorans]MBU9502932.1 hypothetical protein [Burkholderia multivorans]MCA8461305.1 hypothetical protein [Burkholderia multivorans]